MFGAIRLVNPCSISLAGIASKGNTDARIQAALAPLTRALERRWYVDDVFEAGYRWGYLALTAVVGWFDRYVVDGVVNVAYTFTSAGALSYS